MNIVEATQINSFAPVAQQANVSPSEPIFVLTSSQLQDIFKEATKSLESRIDAFEGRIIKQGEKMEALEATQDSQAENELNMLRLINDLRKKEPGKTELSRAEKIEKYLEARPDHKATYESLKGYLGIDNALLNTAIKTLMDSEPGRYGITQTLGDKRKRIITMILR